MQIGFIGLGDMGAPMAANIARAGFNPVVFDKAGTSGRAPEHSLAANDVADVVRHAETIFLSLPDGNASLSVAREIVSATNRHVKTVVDLSTLGVEAAQSIDKLLAEAGITFIDCPVSGGRAGAAKGTITLMWAGPGDVLEGHRPILESFARAIFHVGEQAGQGQAMKLLNNFLSATSMAATTEAILFGQSHGLDMATMLDVLNVSTGQNTATRDKFPERILTGTFDAGFRTALMRKDVDLYVEGVEQAGTPADLAEHVRRIWQEVDGNRPGSDFTEIFRDRSK